MTDWPPLPIVITLFDCEDQTNAIFEMKATCRNQYLLVIRRQSCIRLGNPLGAVAHEVCIHSTNSVCCLCLINRAVNSTLYNAGCALECVQLALGIVHAVAQGLLDAEQFVEILLNLIVIIGTANFDTGGRTCRRCCGT